MNLISVSFPVIGSLTVSVPPPPIKLKGTANEPTINAIFSASVGKSAFSDIFWNLLIPIPIDINAKPAVNIAADPNNIPAASHGHILKLSPI